MSRKASTLTCEKPMAEDRPPPADLLAKAADGNFMRSVTEAVLQMLMEVNVEGHIGAGRCERCDKRLNHCNAFRHRTLDTRLGPMHRHRGPRRAPQPDHHP